MFDGVVLDVCINAELVAHNRRTGGSLSPLRSEFPNAVSDTCGGAEQQDGGGLGDGPLRSFALAFIGGFAVTVRIGCTRDDNRHRKERDDGDGKSSSQEPSFSDREQGKCRIKNGGSRLLTGAILGRARTLSCSGWGSTRWSNRRAR
jgi:hypothetical protein